MKKTALLLLIVVMAQFCIAFAQTEDNAVVDFAEQESVRAVYATDTTVTEQGAVLGVSNGDASGCAVYIDFTDVSEQQYKNYDISVQYYDVGYGWFVIRYIDFCGNEKFTMPICTNNTGELKTFTFTSGDIRMDNSLEGKYDISVTTYKKYAQYYFSKEEVCIKSVELTANGTFACVTADIKSNKVGNIFFTGEQISFTSDITNRFCCDAEVTVAYEVYKYDDALKPQKCSFTEFEISLKGLETSSRDISFAAEEYGLYCINVVISGYAEGQIISYTHCYEFSKCMYNATLNKLFGANGTMHYGVGDTDASIELYKGAGIGVARGAMNWNSYEPDENTRRLSGVAKYAYNALYEENIDYILTILAKNPNIDNNIGGLPKYVLPSFDEKNQQALYNYAYNLMLEPEINRLVDMVEIENEPDTIAYYDGGVPISVYEKATGNGRELVGERYGKVACLLAQAVKDAKPNAKVGGLTVAGLYADSTKRIVDAAFDVFSKNKFPFDVITLHPYIGGDEDPEPGNFGGVDGIYNNYSVAELIKYYDDLTSGRQTGITTKQAYNFGTKSKWYTEYGWSTSTNTSKRGYNAADCEYDAAKKLVRTYFILKEYGFDDIVCMYNIMDSNYIDNMNESGFGLVKYCDEIDVPYAAKYGYIAVAAMNGFLSEATSCTSVYNNDYSYINKFECGSRDVYAMWTSKSENAEFISYDLPKSAEYYDMLGNRIPTEEVATEDGVYVTDSPIYAVCGEPFEVNTPARQIKINSDNSVSIRIYGSASPALANKSVSVTVLKPDTAFDSPDKANSIIYADQTVTNRLGEFDLTANIPRYNENVHAYIVPEGTTVPIVMSFDCKSSIAVRLYNGIVELGNTELDMIDLKNTISRVDGKMLNKGSQYKIVYAMYNGKKLAGINIKDGSASNDIAEFNFSYDTEIKFDSIKVFAVKNFETAEPLCTAFIIN